MAKFEAEFKKSALKQLRSLPNNIQKLVLNSITNHFTVNPYIADGKHIKKLSDGYRLRVGDYRVFYYIESKVVIITSVVRRTSTTY